MIFRNPWAQQAEAGSDGCPFNAQLNHPPGSPRSPLTRKPEGSTPTVTGRPRYHGSAIDGALDLFDGGPQANLGEQRHATVGVACMVNGLFAPSFPEKEYVGFCRGERGVCRENMAMGCHIHGKVSMRLKRWQPISQLPLREMVSQQWNQTIRAQEHPQHSTTW